MLVKAFELIVGHPVLNFVNTLDNRFGAEGPDELLTSYGDLLRFLEQSQMLTDGQARQLARNATKSGERRALESALKLREALSETLYGQLGGRPARARTIALLETHFHEAGARQTLARGEAGFFWSWKNVQNQTHFPVWLLARAASEFLLSEALGRVRSCDCAACRWLFIDTSKNGKRRWCSMRICGNRMKARRFHARREDSGKSR